jgi:signal transduction histidine kinase
MPQELKRWLESSTIPWLANREDGQPSPIAIAGASVFETVINLPIRYEGRALGLLCILWNTQPDLSPDNLAHLIALTERVSSAIQNEALRKKSENAALLEERNRLARELHDSVSQSLYSQCLLAEAAGDMLAQNELSRLESCLVDLKESSLQVLKEMRLLLFELRPPMVGEQDLAKALKNRLEAVERRAGVASQLIVDGTVVLPANIQNDLYYIALEALNNSLKHSGANSIHVLIDSNEHELQLTIEDNGKGFKTDQNQSAGLGLTTMQERVNQLGGHLNLISVPGKGTRVAVKLELKKE